MLNKKMTLIFGLASMTLMTACGGRSNDSSKPNPDNSKDSATSATTPVTPDTDEEFDPKKPVEITFWHTMGKTTGQPILDQIITAFNKIYPHIKVTNTQQGDYDKLNEIINNNISTGNLPTMAYAYEDHVAGYVDHNASLDMTSYINDPVYGLGHNPKGYDLGDLGVEDMSAGYWKAGSKYAVEGMYSLPFSKSTEVLFYNKTVFDAKGWTVPETWDELWELCETIKSDNTYKDDKYTCLGWDSDANLLITSFIQRGLPYTTSQRSGAENSHFHFSTQANKDLVTKLKEYYDKKYFLTKGTSANNAYTSTQFTAQSILMSVSSTGGTGYCYTADFETGVTGIPQYDKTNKAVISQGPSITFFKKGTTKAQRTAAWLFYKFATNTKNSALFGSDTGYNPVRNSSFSDPIFEDAKDTAVGKNALIQDMFSYVGSEESGYAEAQFTSPAFKGSSQARSSMDGLLSSVLLGTKTVDQAFDQAMSDCLFAE